MGHPRQEHGHAAEDEGQGHTERFGALDPPGNKEACQSTAQAGERTDHAGDGSAADLRFIDHIVRIVQEPGVPEDTADQVGQDEGDAVPRDLFLAGVGGIGSGGLLHCCLCHAAQIPIYVGIEQNG